MSLPEIEFELSALQYELMGYPGLTQGQSLTLTLDAGVLLPDSTADSWFTVQQAALPLQLQHVGPAQYAFAGQIVAAELFKQDGADTGIVVVNCGDAPVRVTCGPREDGLLPWGTWETRYLTGFGRLQGIVDEAYTTLWAGPSGSRSGVCAGWC